MTPKTACGWPCGGLLKKRKGRRKRKRYHTQSSHSMNYISQSEQDLSNPANSPNSYSLILSPQLTYTAWLPKFEWRRQQQQQQHRTDAALPTSFSGAPSDSSVCWWRVEEGCLISKSDPIHHSRTEQMLWCLHSLQVRLVQTSEDEDCCLLCTANKEEAGGVRCCSLQR